MSTPISSLTASSLTSLLISHLSGQLAPPGSAHAHLSALPVLGGATSSSLASTSSASSTASSSSTSISILQGGHTNSVLSLALNASGTLLASGGEDGHLCLWLTSENRLLKRRALVHGHVHLQTPSAVLRLPNIAARGSRSATSASTHVQQPSAAVLMSGPIRHVVFANRPENERRLFVACGPYVYEVDVTRFEAGSGPFQPRLIAQHEEDVNQIALNDSETFAAACDDSGNIKIIELESVVLGTRAAQLPPSATNSSRQSPTEGVLSNSGSSQLRKVRSTSASPASDDTACSSNATTPTQVDAPFASAATQTRSAPRVILSVKKHASVCSSLCFRRCSRKDCGDAAAEARANASAGANGFKWQLVSGGLDCKLQLIEFQRSGRSVNIFDMNEFVDQDSTTFALNPPLIHTVAVTSDGAIVACGLENGNIELFDARRKNLTHLQTLYAHSQAVSKVLFVPASVSSTNHAVRVNYLISAGHDGNMFCWEVKDAGVHNATVSAHHAHHSHGQHSHHDGISIKVINCVEHWHKINWIEAKSIDKVYIGDQSTQIASCSLVP